MVHSLDDFYENITTQETRKRLQAHAELVPFLSDPRSDLICVLYSIDTIIEGLAAWIKCSNYKVSLNGLEVLCLMVDRMGENFKPHVTTVLPPVIDRLGDSKDQVREMAMQLLLKLMMPASTPQFVFDRLGPAFHHKLWHVKEGLLITLQNTINRYGARCLLLSKLVPEICKLLDDQTPQVREAAANTLVEIYRHVGERVRSDLKSKGLVSQQRMTVLENKFDEVRSSGNMLPTANMGGPSRGGSTSGQHDDFDFAKPAASKPVHRKPSSSSTTSKRTTGIEPRRKRSASAGVSGAVDEELFSKSFQDVPKAKIFSARDVQEQMLKCKEIFADSNTSWEKRIDHIKHLRALLEAGAADYDDFYQSLRMLESSFIMVVKDLRSQVVREGCITIAYMSQKLGPRFDHFAEALLPALLILIPNSAKVMATSGLVCIRFIVQYVHTNRLIPIITGNLASKNNIIRRSCYEFINQILHSWPTHCLEKHIAILQESIKKGISDADSDARAYSRKAFWGFADHFKSQADSLLGSLDASKQKMLQGEISNSSSNSSLNGDHHTRPRPRSRAASEERSGYAGGAGTSSLRKAPQRISSSRSDAGDLEPQQLHRTDFGFGAHKARQKSGSSSSAGSPFDYDTPKGRAQQQTPRRGVSQSQPNSRSNSPTPSSRRQLHYAKTASSRIDTGLGPRRVRVPGSHSQGASREASPSRSTRGAERRLSGNSMSKVSSGRKTPVLSQKLLRQGTDVEDALNDALSKGQARRRYDTYDSDDAASETSSVCSERSHSSYGGRTSESERERKYTRRKSRGRTRSFSSGYGVTEDMHSIISQLGSASHLDRKDGLLSLQHLLRSNRALSRVELKKVTEMFTRMFHDPHSKVLSVFLDTLIELVYIQSADLGDWLHILLPRLLTKAGSDMLGSVANKVQRTLDVVRDCFPCDHQFNTLSKFIVDQAQGTNLKVRVPMLMYMNSLVRSMDLSDFVNSMDARLAISKIINWTTEPRNPDVRKAAQSVLISLFNLNTAEFSHLLADLPKAFQDGAARILRSHIRAANEGMTTTDVLSPRNVASPTGHTGHNRSRPPSRSSQGPHDDFETENLNPEDIINSIKKTSADIQNLSINSKLEQENVKKKHDFTSQDSGIQDLRTDSPDGLGGYKGGGGGVGGGGLGGGGMFQHTSMTSSMYMRNNDSVDALNGEDVGSVLEDIQQELSNHNERVDQRKNAMHCLQNVVENGEVTDHLLETHFKSLLLILLETLGDVNGDIKVLVLRCLQKMLQKFPSRFEDYAELTILRVLDLHKDDTYRDKRKKKVPYAASEVEDTLVKALPPEQNFRILTPIIQDMDYHQACGAIQMMTKVVEKIPKDVLEASLPNLIPGLFKNFEHTESPVRKAACFCLVSIYMQVEEALRPYMDTLNGHRMKLLNLYIKKRKMQETAS